MAGQMVGPYELIEEVGRGGMAAVYRARQPNMNRFVAVKVIYRSIASDSKALERFKREAELVAQMEHPHILPVYDYNGENDPPYIVMRYLPTGTLRDVMTREQLPMGEIAYLLGQVASALDYAHKKGIVHRDIKPSNIMIDGEGNAFLTDFGIARMVESSQGLTGTGIAVGTPGYMAPEQGMGNATDARADVYALGVMVYELLTGTMPFVAETPMGVVLKHISEPVPDILLANPNLPPMVSDVIKRAMSKKAEDRYPTAGEFARAFQTSLGSNTSLTPNKLQAVAARTIGELEAARAANPTNLPLQTGGGGRSSGNVPPNQPGTAILPPTGGQPASMPIQNTNTQTAQVARGAALGAGAVVLLLLLMGAGAFIAIQVISNTQNSNATATGAALALINGNASATAVQLGNVGGSATGIAIALAGTEGAKVTPTATPPNAATGTTIPTVTVAATIPTTIPPTIGATHTPAPPTAIPPSSTPRPSETPRPTFTALPTYTAFPTYTPFPSATASWTPKPSETPRPTAIPSSTPSPIPPTLIPTRTPSPIPPTVTLTFTPSPIPPTFTFTPVPPTPTPFVIVVTSTPAPGQPTLVPAVVPTSTPMPSPTVVAPGQLPYVSDYESDDALKLYDFDATAWKLIPDSGNTSLVGTGGQQKPIVVLGKGSPAWRDSDNRNLLLTVSVNLLGDGSIARIIFRHGDKGYYALEIGAGLLAVTRGANATIATGTERPLTGGRITGAPIRSRQFYTYLVWADDTRVYVYQDNRLLMQAKDPNSDLLPGGNLLFLTKNSGASFGVSFDNVKVQRPAVPSQHFAVAGFPNTWDRTNITDAVLGGTDTKYLELSAGSTSPKTGQLSDFLLACRLFNQEGGFEIRFRESSEGAYLMRFDGGNMTLLAVDSQNKERTINVFQNFYQRGFFQEFTTEFVGDRVTIISGRTLWSQEIKGGPRKGEIRFSVTRPKDGVRITDFLVAETARSLTESAAWVFEKIATVEARTPAQLLTEFYDFFQDKFAKKDWWEGGTNAAGEPKFDNKAPREHQQYLEMTSKAGASFRNFRLVPGEFLLFGSGLDKTRFFDASDVYLRVNVRLDQPGTAYIQTRTNKTVGGSGLTGYQLALTRKPDNSFTVVASQIDGTGSRTEYYRGGLLLAPGQDLNYNTLLIVNYQDQVAFFVNGRFLTAQDDLTILGGTVSLGVEEGTTARFDNFQLRDVSPETR